jgi:S1-C subfamily serine protease
MTSFHMAWRRYSWTDAARSAKRKGVSAMRRESSEQRLGSATVPSHLAHLARFARLASGRWRPGLAVAMLLVGTACSAGWSGSIGAILGKGNDDGRLFVREAPAGMGAARAGVAVGDELVAIDGKPVARMSPTEVHEALAGKVGTKVKLTVLRGGTTTDVEVERGPLSGG